MPKALIPYPDKLLVERAVDTLREAGLSQIVVVLGAAAEQVLAAAPGLPTTVINPDWPTGLGSSLRAGLQALTGTPAASAVVLLVDMPGVTPEAVRRVTAHAGAD